MLHIWNKMKKDHFKLLPQTLHVRPCTHSVPIFALCYLLRVSFFSRRQCNNRRLITKPFVDYIWQRGTVKRGLCACADITILELLECWTGYYKSELCSPKITQPLPQVFMLNGSLISTFDVTGSIWQNSFQIWSTAAGYDKLHSKFQGVILTPKLELKF